MQDNWQDVFYKELIRMEVVDATSCFFLNGNVKRNEKSKINLNQINSIV